MWSLLSLIGILDTVSTVCLFLKKIQSNRLRVSDGLTSFLYLIKLESRPSNQYKVDKSSFCRNHTVNQDYSLTIQGSQLDLLLTVTVSEWWKITTSGSRDTVTCQTRRSCHKLQCWLLWSWKCRYFQSCFPDRKPVRRPVFPCKLGWFHLLEQVKVIIHGIYCITWQR